MAIMRSGKSVFIFVSPNGTRSGDIIACPSSADVVNVGDAARRLAVGILAQANAREKSVRGKRNAISPLSLYDVFSSFTPQGRLSSGDHQSHQRDRILSVPVKVRTRREPRRRHPPRHCRADSLHCCSAGGVVRAAASRASHKAWIRGCRFHGRSVDHARYGLCACRLHRAKRRRRRQVIPPHVRSSPSRGRRISAPPPPKPRGGRRRWRGRGKEADPGQASVSTCILRSVAKGLRFLCCADGNIAVLGGFAVAIN